MSRRTTRPLSQTWGWRHAVADWRTETVSADKLKKEGKDFMIYGILILFVMTTLWAIILFARDFVFGSGYKGDIDSGVDIIDSPSSDQPFENTDQLFEEQPQYAV